MYACSYFAPIFTSCLFCHLKFASDCVFVFLTSFVVMFCCRSTQNNPLGKSGQRLLYKNYLFKNKTEVNNTGANPESLVSVCVGGGGGGGGERGNRAIASSY